MTKILPYLADQSVLCAKPQSSRLSPPIIGVPKIRSDSSWTSVANSLDELGQSDHSIGILRSREWTSTTGQPIVGQMAGWAVGYDMELEFIQSGNSTQNSYVEQFNRRNGGSGHLPVQSLAEINEITEY